MMITNFKHFVGWTILAVIALSWLYGIVHNTWVAHGWNALWILPIEFIAVIAAVAFMEWLLN